MIRTCGAWRCFRSYHDRHSPFAKSEQAPSGSLALIISWFAPSVLDAAFAAIMIAIRRSRWTNFVCSHSLTLIISYHGHTGWSTKRIHPVCPSINCFYADTLQIPRPHKERQKRLFVFIPRITSVFLSSAMLLPVFVFLLCFVYNSILKYHFCGQYQ